MYIVEKKIDGIWYPYGTWKDSCQLAHAMWELGLQRYDFEDIRIRQEGEEAHFQGDESYIKYLMEKCNVTYEVALVALNHCSGSVIHAYHMLQSEICKAQYMREVREYELG